MKLIEIYVQEVVRRLPEKQRSDIGLELRSTIEDMLPENFTEEDVKDVLAELGHPAKLAAGYHDKPMYLIGPRYFDVYVKLLNLIIPLAMVISFAVVVVGGILSHTGGLTINGVLGMIGEGIWVSIGAGMQTFFWITLTFALVERVDNSGKTNPLTTNWKEWTPNDLKEVPYIPKEKAISKLEFFGSFIWSVIWAAFYFNANRIIGIYENSPDGLVLKTPIFDQDVLLSYWPLVILVILTGLVFFAYKWKLGQWTKKLAFANTVVQLVSVSVFILIFSNHSIFNPEFLVFVTEKLGVTLAIDKMLWLAIVITVISSAADVYQGFRKAAK
ncbi:hypothetical protein FIU87_03840 [Bacillus sp. THAF10]|uniref:HAAS signaling domain-containing protein n=1 Tax=Bacillus sp. THAF10 TaxID=2587848 RepID=UPI001268ED99|nr:hypothetical protein [Bacillus sp. THAF10]QFT87776.1 hypothetical protein FIU87_03840 [Bacillus sp. THAF10]